MDVTDSANKTVCVHQPTECEGDVWCVHCHKFLSWSARIPAAIKKAEGWLLNGTLWAMWYSGKSGSTEPTDIITAGELALAKALWEDWDAFGKLHVAIPQPALIAFTEKAEKLT